MTCTFAAETLADRLLSSESRAHRSLSMRIESTKNTDSTLQIHRIFALKKKERIEFFLVFEKHLISCKLNKEPDTSINRLPFMISLQDVSNHNFDSSSTTKIISIRIQEPTVS
jgi:hypothetical protein